MIPVTGERGYVLTLRGCPVSRSPGRRSRPWVHHDAIGGCVDISADAGAAVVTSYGGDVAAVDHYFAIVLVDTAADTGTGVGADFGVRNNLAGALTVALGVDRQRAGRRNIQTLHIQSITVAEDQIRVAREFEVI